MNDKPVKHVRSGGRLAAVGWLLACVGTGIAGQSQAEKAKEATSPPAHSPAQAPPSPPTSPQTLDELLGISTPAPTGKPDSAAKRSDGRTNSGAGESASKDPSSAQLDQLLTGKQVADAFEQATRLMNDAARRLDDQSDAGLDTQRMQEDIIRKLEQVLDAIQQQSQQQSSSSSKAKPSEQQGEPQNSEQKRSQSQQQRSQGDSRNEAMPPEKVEGALPAGLEGARAAWGALPSRVREMLMQGAGDRFSSKYQGLTEAYYRRLAEEKDKK